MQTIGERLEEARKRKGISIREAAESTKIRSDYLQKFEASTFEIDLPPLYIRGFLRSYARYLDLDPERIVNDYNQLLSEGKPAKRETREVYGRVDFADRERAKEPNESPAPGRKAQDQAMLLKFGLLGGGAIVLAVVVIFLVKLIFSDSSSSAGAGAQSAAQKSKTVQAHESIFTITVVEATRVKVAYVDDSTVFLDGKFPLSRGETRTIKYTKDLLVTVEYPDRIRIELNGRAAEVPVSRPMGQFRVPVEIP